MQLTVVFSGLGKASAKPGVKRGRPSNAAKAAAAAAEAAARAAAEAEMAAAAQSDNDQMGSPNGGYQGDSRGVHYDDGRGVTQEEWEAMGFHGQLQQVEGMHHQSCLGLFGPKCPACQTA